jgi:hypothetical protein
MRTALVDNKYFVFLHNLLLDYLNHLLTYFSDELLDLSQFLFYCNMTYVEEDLNRQLLYYITTLTFRVLLS